MKIKTNVKLMAICQMKSENNFNASIRFFIDVITNFRI